MTNRSAMRTVLMKISPITFDLALLLIVLSAVIAFGSSMVRS